MHLTQQLQHAEQLAEIRNAQPQNAESSIQSLLAANSHHDFQLQLQQQQQLHEEQLQIANDDTQTSTQALDNLQTSNSLQTELSACRSHIIGLEQQLRSSVPGV